MSLTVYRDLVQGSDAWLQARCGIVTASVVGQLVTPSTLKVAANDKSRAIVLDLVAQRITGHVEDTGMSADMWRGVECEPLARDAYARHTGVEVDQAGFMVRDFGSYSIGASPDGLPGDGYLEIKAPRQKEHLRTILADGVPTQYMAQVQTGLLVSGRPWCDFVSFCGGMPLYVKRVTPDPAWQDAIKRAAQAFEDAAAQMTDTYTRAVVGLPMTERIEMGDLSWT